MTFPLAMTKYILVIKFMTRMKTNDEEKEENKTTDSEITTFDEGKGVNNERGGYITH